MMSLSPHRLRAVPLLRSRWLQRFGVLAFVFFLVKGLLWLAGPALLLWLGAAD